MFIAFKELSNNSDVPSMKDHMEQYSYPNEEQVISYLWNSGEIQFVRLSRAKDVFTGKYIPEEVQIRSDGEYTWSNYLGYYVKHYHLRMPKEFEQHILEHMKSRKSVRK